ncbi:MAG: phosphotransferase [Clostridium sp.]|uniref:hypothetical protein n=1 Tax=Clostridium sp. TaxID=1506 RepID=UPI003031B561
MERKIEEKAKKYFGKERGLKDIERLLGGAQKHTYLATLDNGFKFVVYVWDKSTNYFSDSESVNNNVFLSSSPLMFRLNNELMIQHGVKTPKLYYIDSSFEEASYAFVEYIEGFDLDYIIENQSERLNEALKSLKESIDDLHEIKGKEVGQVNNLLGESFNQIKYCYEEAMQNIKYLIKVDSDNSNIYLQLNGILENLMKNIEKRSEFKLIHSELGPNHVMVDKDNNAYIIDIEGARFFDLEYEESFLKIRFDSNYKYLKSDNLDETRMEFYHICHCTGNLTGAYELLYKNYYDTEDILGMINYFTKAIQAVCS